MEDAEWSGFEFNLFPLILFLFLITLDYFYDYFVLLMQDRVV